MRSTTTLTRMVILVTAFVAANLCVTNTVLAQRVYRESDSSMRNLIRRIETRSDTFSRTLENALDRSPLNGTSREDEINRLVTDFEFATDQLRTRFEGRQSTAADARAVLDRAARINNFLLNNRLDFRVDEDWRLLRRDLDRLASAYNVAWNWNTAPAPGGPIYGVDAQLTGTYRLDTSRSTDPRRAAEDATRNLPPGQRQRVYDSLIARLEAPDTLAIERRGSNVAIASSRAPQINCTQFGSFDSEHA